MDDKQRVALLKRYVSKQIERNAETVRILLNIGRDNLIAVLQIDRDELYSDLHTLNDGEYMTRNKLIHLLDEVIEIYKELNVPNHPTKGD